MNPYPWPADVQDAIRKAQKLVAEMPEGVDPWNRAKVSKGTDRRTTTTKGYRVLSHHLDSGTRVRAFSSAKAAEAYADGINPDTDGSVYPNITEDEIAAHTPRGFEYYRGAFWLGNRPAVILCRV